MTFKTLHNGCANTLLCSIVILCSFIRGYGQSQDSTPRGSAYGLTKLNVYPHDTNSDTYWYQARCSIPCSGSYRPGSLYITVNADRVFTTEFEAYGNFEASEQSYSSVWWLLNINWLTANQGRCQFDFQFAYTLRYPEPTGTCQMGWNMTTECLVPDNTQSCSGIDSNPDLCYDHAIYSQCCHTCASRDVSSPTDDIYCPYGDRDSSRCDGLSQVECYTTNFTCCGTCKTYEESIEGCRYGNRNPDVCDFIVHADCYNTTLERDCCYECNGLADDNYPDCMYGDKSTECNGIERRDCYRNQAEKTCCQTCGDYYSDIVPNCEYGDREYCYDVQESECLNDPNVRDNCCETCNFLIENDCRSNEDNCPSNFRSYDCYNSNIRQRCCRTCLSYYDVSQGENCLYGDRQPDLCYNITGNMCYNNDVALDCCLQCSYFTLDHLPQTCLYGNKDPCTNLATYECYQPTIEDKCCETCHAYNRTDLGYDCRYGDKIDSCYNRPIYSCYDDNSRSTCCQFCSVNENKDEPDCPYGDRFAWCTSTLTPSMCYENEAECCVSCDRMIKGHLDQNTCKYGDRKNCLGTTAAQCYNANVEYDCCETCFNLRNSTNNDCVFGDSADCSDIPPWQCYGREDECCATCNNYIKPGLVADDCKYGDRASSCPTINSFQCYDPNTAYRCCETCLEYRRDDLPDSCRYGDKSSVCVSGDAAHGSYCYNATIQDKCCAACQSVETDDPTCLYGDKATYCLDIEARNCYQATTETTCCQTCPSFYQTSYLQGCKYGDSNRNCQTSSCDSYSDQRLQECCYTCRAYKPTTTPLLTTLATPTGKEESTGGGSSGTTVRYSSVGTHFPTPSTTGGSSTTTEPATSRFVTKPTTTRRLDLSDTTNGGSGTTTTPSLPPTTSTNGSGETASPSDVMKSTRTIFDNTGAIVGGIIGAIVVTVIIVGIAFYCIRVRNKTPRPDYDKSSFDPLDAGRGTQFSPRSPASSVQYNPNGQMSFNPGGRTPSGTQGSSLLNNQATSKAPPKRQESEEVYDYINPDDVKSVVSMPITRRPTLPERREENTYEPYLQPLQNGDAVEKTGYDNPGLAPAEHQYYTLQKEPDQRL